MSRTLESFLKQAVETPSASPTPRLDAEVLTMHVTGLTRAQLITHADRLLTPEQETRLRALIERRVRGEPVAYLTGRREFWSLELAVTPAVLIPRPETELLVEQALARIPADAESTIADLGTGSGAIALAIARERPRCRVIATDASPAALDVARENARRLGIGNVEFHSGEWFTPLAGLRFHLIVSNPPYVAEGDPHLDQGDLRFEPRAALVAGADGLDAIRRLIHEAPAYLRPGGWLLLEHGAEQGPAVEQLFLARNAAVVISECDLAGHRRLAGAYW